MISSSESSIRSAHSCNFEAHDTPIAYSISDAVRASGLGRTTLYSLIKSGDLPAIKIGTRTLIRHADIERLFDRNQTPLIPCGIKPHHT